MLVWLCGAMACVWWSFQSSQWNWRYAVGAAAVLLCGVAAGASWRGLFTGELHWDGQQWWAESTAPAHAGSQEPSAVQPFMCLDLAGLFLLRLDRPKGGARRWCGLQRADDPARWGDLRRALYSSGTASGNPPAAPDTGTGAN